jgi:hypothetical protein
LLAVVTALSASAVGSFLFNLWILIYAPGDGGWEAAIGAATIFFLIGIFAGFLCGLPVLLFIGVPISWMLRSLVPTRPLLGLVVGILAGIVAGISTTMVLDFGHSSFVLAAGIFGGAYGVIWTWMYRKHLVTQAGSALGHGALNG